MEFVSFQRCFGFHRASTN